MKSPDRMSREELEEEVAFLRGELAINEDADKALALRMKWNLSPFEARFLCALHSAGGRVRNKESIYRAVWPDDGPELKIVDVFACKVRQKIGFDLIATAWGIGYSMTLEGRRQVDELFECPSPAVVRATPPGADTKPENVRAKRELLILALLLKGEAWVQEVARVADIGRQTAYTCCRRLVLRGLVEQTRGVRGVGSRFRITEDGAKRLAGASVPQSVRAA